MFTVRHSPLNLLYCHLRRFYLGHLALHDADLHHFRHPYSPPSNYSLTTFSAHCFIVAIILDFWIIIFRHSVGAHHQISRNNLESKHLHSDFPVRQHHLYRQHPCQLELIYPIQYLPLKAHGEFLAFKHIDIFILYGQLTSHMYC